MNPQPPSAAISIPNAKPDLYKPDSLRNFRRPRRKVLLAARLVAEGNHKTSEVAELVGISEHTMRSWRLKPAFLAVVHAYRKRFDAEVQQVDIAGKNGRIAAHVQGFRRIERIIEKRAADPRMETAPGGDTGMLAVERVCIGGGEHGEFLDKFTFDAALDRQRTEKLELIAKEQGGQFEDKPAPGTVNDNRKVIFNFPVLSAEDLAAVESAPTIDLPVPARRLLQRPSDGAQR